MIDPHQLERFVTAQMTVYTTVLRELSAGRKQTHWIWFIFPQADGLGHSQMAHTYAIKSRAEAKAYLSHPILGVRLLECTEAVLQHTDLTAHQIFGSPDDLKFRSSMTLFEQAGGGPYFMDAVDRFYEGENDAATRSIWATWKD